MNDSGYLGMRPGDLDGKPYARFWQPAMSPMPPHVSQALRRGDAPRDLAFGLDQARELLAPGYLALENGYTRRANGQMFVAARTEMPGATGAMFEWWMGWHYMEAQRYKLWHPRAHVSNGTEAMRGDEPGLSDREKYRTTHYITEYIGQRRERIKITFTDPREFFGEDAALDAAGTTALVCGRVELWRAPVTIGWLVHQIRENDKGTEMRSRFWLGPPELTAIRRSDPRNRLLGSRWLQRLVLPRELGRDMLVHCAMEMNHLGSFLPELYALYHEDETGPTARFDFRENRRPITRTASETVSARD